MKPVSFKLDPDLLADFKATAAKRGMKKREAWEAAARAWIAALPEQPTPRQARRIVARARKARPGSYGAGGEE